MAVAVRLTAATFLATFMSWGGVSAQNTLAHQPQQFVRFQIPDSITVPRLTGTYVRQGAQASARPREIGLLIGIIGVALAASAVGEQSVLDCGPCDRSEVPFFDRWAIRGIHDEWDRVSTGTLFLAAGVAWADGFKQSEGSPIAHLGASIESLVLTFAATDLLKRAAERKRPFAYHETLADITAANLNQARSSWPSGHASLAFALGTSYWLSRGHEASPTVKRVVAAATVLTALLRVPAGRHFPSDVVSGAALGMGSALLVHTVRF